MLSKDEHDRRGEQNSHDDVEDSQSPRSTKRALDGGAERQPEEAARQRGEKEEGTEAGRLNERASRLGAEKRSRGAGTHEPGFRVDLLKDRRAQVPDGIRPRDRIDAAGRRRNSPGQPEQDRRTTPVESLEQQGMREDKAPETERYEKHHQTHARGDTEQTGKSFPDARLRPGRGQHDVARARGHRGDDGEQKKRRDLLRSRRLPPRSEGSFRTLSGVCE